jgi:hypothetical protein
MVTGGAGGKVSLQNHPCLLSDFGCHAAVVRSASSEPHAANWFLSEWFVSRPLSSTESGGDPAAAKEEINTNLGPVARQIRAWSGENWKGRGSSHKNLGFFFVSFTSETAGAKSGWPHPPLLVG